ncbi:MAG: hypothetical protein J5993_01110 [Clostridia bacterium]|nr:hypothetical protein [Clostridia bacterium]
MEEFVKCLLQLNKQLVGIFKTGNAALLKDMNRTIQKMCDIQRKSSEFLLGQVADECKIIGENFNHIVIVMQTNEGETMEESTQKAVNHFLHIINDASVMIAKKFQLV